MTTRTPLRHWMLHNDVLAREFDEILKLSPGYNPVRLIDPALTFHASLVTGTNDILGKSGIFSRSSSGTYWGADGVLREASADQSRHEWRNGQPIGLLMEPSRTNKCENYNANPDAALTGLDHQLGGVMTRVLDVQALQAAGLQQIATSGYVVDLDATQSASTALCYIDGATGTTGNHTCSVYARALTGTGNFGLSHGTSLQTFENPQYQRLINIQVPTSTANRFLISALAGAHVRFVLNQLETSQTESSVILTKGTAASRAPDVLNWPIGDPRIINNAEGMVAIVWRPGFGDSQLGTGSVQTGRLLNVQTQLLNPQKLATSENTFYIDDGTTGTAVTVAGGWVAHRDYLITGRWAPGTKHSRYKAAGAWAAETAGGYDGSFTDDGFLRLVNFADAPQLNAPVHARGVYLWEIDRGAGWLEDFFGGVAN